MLCKIVFWRNKALIYHSNSNLQWLARTSPAQPRSKQMAPPRNSRHLNMRPRPSTHTEDCQARRANIQNISYIDIVLAIAVNESFHNIHNLTFLDIYLLKSKCYMPKVMIGRNFLSFIELCTCTDRSHTSHT